MTATSPVLPPPMDAATAQEAYAKRRIALRYWLAGAGMDKAALAMAFAEDHHRGFRRDGVTPEFAHQVAIVSYLRTLVPHLAHPQDTLAAGFLHDVREDYDVSDDEIRSRFGDRVADAVQAMTKEYRGVRRPEDEVFAAIARNEVASVVKLADRIHNLDSMLGVFTAAKARAYVDETSTWFLPMLRQARREFPTQEPAYENAKLVLLAQMRVIAALVETLPDSP